MKKSYAKPTLRRYGSVSGLTQLVFSSFCAAPIVCTVP
jgi:hypothetical protein